MEQDYDADDDKRHITWLIEAFRDPRYIRHEGKPIFLVYGASKLPNPIETTSLWREEVRKADLGELFLCRVESFAEESSDPIALGFDCAVEFQPDWSNLGFPLRQSFLWFQVRKLGLTNQIYNDNTVYEYREIVSRMLKKKEPGYRRIPCVTPSWDNSPRRNPAIILTGSTPDLYEEWLRATAAQVESHGQSPFLFINAWNEWAEGNHLEPCQKWGRAYLEATRRALANSGS